MLTWAHPLGGGPFCHGAARVVLPTGVVTNFWADLQRLERQKQLLGLGGTELREAATSR